MKKIFLCLAISIFTVLCYAQNDLQKQYRKLVFEYSHDIKNADYMIYQTSELEKAALADYLPRINATGDFSYTGNPIEITTDIAGQSVVLGGNNHMKYGAALSVIQPVYAGGEISEAHKMAKQEREMSEFQKQIISNNLLFAADQYYWNTVACYEMISIAEAYCQSLSKLVDVVKTRVEVDYTDRNELLMAEVKLNDANYQLIQARNNYEVARMSMNSFAGIVSDSIVQIDSIVTAIYENITAFDTTYSNIDRFEISAATQKIQIEKSAGKIAVSEYMPKINIGMEGNIYSPGYDFTSDMNPNYAVYAQINIPITQWAKGARVKKASRHNIQMAEENLAKVKDDIKLEIQTAYYNYTEALDKIRLTENSLLKAKENEEMAMERYEEGEISIVEVINAQVYHLQAKRNFTQSKLNAQIAKSEVERAIGRY